MGNYRSQWKQIDRPYLSQAIGGDKQFYVRGNQISGGAFIVNDQSAGSLKVMKFLLSAGYHKKIQKHGFHGGIQFGYVRKNIDPTKETFPSQFNWTSGAFDPTLSNNETSLQPSTGFLDVNIGAGYDITIGKARPYFNAALFHINYPTETFFETNKLKPRKVFNGGARVDLTNKIAIDPSFFLMENVKANEFLIGSNLHYRLTDAKINPTSVYVGGFFRDGINANFDAMIATTGLYYKSFLVGLSYDVNLSTLKTATNNRGAFEISFIYTSLSTRLKKIEIPCDRY